jgi:hypothetical protein
VTSRRHGGEGGRQAAVLWRGDANRWNGGAIEWEARWRALLPRRRGGARSQRAVTALR